MILKHLAFVATCVSGTQISYHHTNNNATCRCETQQDSRAGAVYTQQCHQVGNQFSALFLSTLPQKLIATTTSYILVNKSLAQPSNCNHFLSVGSFISLLFTGPSSLSLTSHYSTLKSVSLNSFLSVLLLSQRCRLQTVSLNTLLLLNCTN